MSNYLRRKSSAENLTQMYWTFALILTAQLFLCSDMISAQTALRSTASSPVQQPNKLYTLPDAIPSQAQNQASIHSGVNQQSANYGSVNPSVPGTGFQPNYSPSAGQQNSNLKTGLQNFVPQNSVSQTSVPKNSGQPAIYSNGNIPLGNGYEKNLRDRKTWIIRSGSSEQIAKRIYGLLPKENAESTRIFLNPADNSITIEGPLSVIAIAKSLIPKMDTNAHLEIDSDAPLQIGAVETGVIETPLTSSLREYHEYIPPVQTTTPGSKIQPVGSYYDPQENRFVRVAYEPENAILPGDESEEEILVVGSETAASNNGGQPAVNPENEAQIVCFQCEPNQTFNIENSLKKQFANQPDIQISSSPQTGKILVLSKTAQMQSVRQYLAGFGVRPYNLNTQGNDPRTQDGTVVQIVPSSLNQASVSNAGPLVQETFVPKNLNAEKIEDLLVKLFEDRLQKISSSSSGNSAQNNPSGQTNSPVNTSANTSESASNSVYRFVKRMNAGNSQTNAFGQSNPNYSGNNYNTNIVPPTCEVSINRGKNNIVISGNQALCQQMITLLETIDKPRSANGNMRRFILLRNSDAESLRKIFEYYSRQPDPSAARSRWGQTRAAMEVDPLLKRIGRFPETTDSTVIRGQRVSERTPANQTLPQNAAEQNNVTRISLADSRAGFSGVNSSAFNSGTVQSQNSGQIRQTDYQGDFGDLGGLQGDSLQGGLGGFQGNNLQGGDFGGGLQGGDFQGDPNFNDNGFGNNPSFGGGNDPYNRNPNQSIGLLQNMSPTVLSDLDVIILDLPEPELKRFTKMIQEIEKLAKLAEPKIEIYNLKYVNCVTLQQLISLFYTDMLTLRQGRAMCIALQNPNAILLIGWGDAMNGMKDLIESLDQPIDVKNSMMQVIQLKYASAQEMVTVLQSAYPMSTEGTGGMAPRIRVYADIRTNSLIIQAAPNDMEEIQALLNKLDINKSGIRLQLKTYKLKNSLAEDIRTTIMGAIQASVYGNQTDSKYASLEILSVDADSRRLIESGIMLDVNITADIQHNMLVVSAPADCIELLDKLIEMLDIAPSKAEIRVFRIINGDATQLQQTLESLLPTSTDITASMPSIPGAVSEKESFVPVRFAIETRTNCIIAAASPGDLQIIEALIISLDRRDTMERKTSVVQLRNVSSDSIATAIQNYLTEKLEIESYSEAVTPYQMYESQIIVVPETVTNTLIISASERYMGELVDLIKILDMEPPQVMIQVMIAEVNLNNHEEFGIEAGLQDSLAFDRSLISSTPVQGTGTADPGFNFVTNNSQGNNYFSNNTKNVAGQVINNLAMGRTSSDVGFGGLVLSASSQSVNVLIRALRERNKVRILSRPQITAMDNQQAFILVGQRVPRVEGGTMSEYGVQSTVEDANVGLILLVTPRVGKDGRVVMEIGAEKSSLGSDADAIPVFSADGEVIKSQTIDVIQAMTMVSACSGETVVLGGLITSDMETIDRGVPYLSDIPWLGWLFRYKKEVESRTELLIILTPHVINNSEDMDRLKREESAKMNWVLEDAQSIHGDLGLYDPLSQEAPRGTRTIKPMDVPEETIPLSENENGINDSLDTPSFPLNDNSTDRDSVSTELKSGTYSGSAGKTSGTNTIQTIQTIDPSVQRNGDGFYQTVEQGTTDMPSSGYSEKQLNEKKTFNLFQDDGANSVPKSKFNSKQESAPQSAKKKGWFSLNNTSANNGLTSDNAMLDSASIRQVAGNDIQPSIASEPQVSGGFAGYETMIPVSVDSGSVINAGYTAVISRETGSDQNSSVQNSVVQASAQKTVPAFTEQALTEKTIVRGLPSQAIGLDSENNTVSGSKDSLTSSRQIVSSIVNSDAKLKAASSGADEISAVRSKSQWSFSKLGSFSKVLVKKDQKSDMKFFTEDNTNDVSINNVNINNANINNVNTNGIHSDRSNSSSVDIDQIKTNETDKNLVNVSSEKPVAQEKLGAQSLPPVLESSRYSDASPASLRR